MPHDPFYWSAEWKAVRRAALERAGGRCQTPKCNAPAVIVDHIIARSRGGTEAPSNLRALCRACDNAVKEARSGQRRSGGKLRAKGCDVNGWPLVE